ncbi:nitroreductase [Furfurilactobacillus curtus]|uniref:Nitrobenzoate reductase n=1 Tax=Furfurilactobacillus curtus TaxID=1746200 RepID=A0ABQ5JT04_9LACO
MEFHDVVYQRRSIRTFKDTPLDSTVLEQLVTDATRAPSWANSQPWHITIVTGATLKRIKKRHYERAVAGRGGTADLSVAHRNDFAREAQQNMENWNQQVNETLNKDPQGIATFSQAQATLFNAAAIVYLTVPQNATGWSLYDLGAVGQTLALSATDHGIGSIPAYELVRYPDIVRQETNLQATQLLAMGIALGIPTDSPINTLYTTRMPLTNSLTLLH